MNQTEILKMPSKAYIQTSDHAWNLLHNILSRKGNFGILVNGSRVFHSFCQFNSRTEPVMDMKFPINFECSYISKHFHILGVFIESSFKTYSTNKEAPFLTRSGKTFQKCETEVGSDQS